MRLAALVTFVLILVLHGCGFPKTGAAPIQVSSNSLDLEWDPPVDPGVLLPGQVLRYRVYSRHLDEGSWKYLKETAGKTFVSITNAEVGGDGTYAFGVRSVSPDGVESPLHTSLDFSADPAGGWYVFWVKSE
jgi:hypothetical protein